MTSEHAELLTAWVSLVGSEPITVSQLIARARNQTPAASIFTDQLQRLQPDRTRVSKVGLGKSLTALVGRPAAGLELQRTFLTSEKQWLYSVGPVGAAFPKRIRKDADKIAIRRAVREKLKVKVAEAVAEFEKTEARIERKAAVAIARQIFEKPQSTDPEKPYVSPAEAARVARHSPHVYRERTESPREAASRAGNPAASRRTLPREVRPGVIATSPDTGSAEQAHRAAYNFALLGVPAEVRKMDGRLHLFSPCAPSEIEARRLRFIRSGYRALKGTDALSEYLAPPPPVHEKCRAPSGSCGSWSVFD